MSDYEKDLHRWAVAASHLCRRWELKVNDWYLADESFLFLQDYDVEPDDGWERAFTVHLDLAKLAWEPAEDAIAPPPDTPAAAAWKELVEDADVPIQLISFERYSTPLTFRKTITLDGEDVEIASPKALARRRTVDVLNLIRRDEPATREEGEALRAGIPRLERLAAYSWPRRDRWFSKFCRELAEIYLAIADGHPPRPSQVVKFGRRHVVV